MKTLGAGRFSRFSRFSRLAVSSQAQRSPRKGEVGTRRPWAEGGALSVRGSPSGGKGRGRWAHWPFAHSGEEELLDRGDKADNG